MKGEGGRLAVVSSPAKAVQAFLRNLRERKDVERYVKGYLEHPEQAEEVDAVRAVGSSSLAAEPWD